MIPDAEDTRVRWRLGGGIEFGESKKAGMPDDGMREDHLKNHMRKEVN
jgi:hypothetical protein